MSQLFGKYGRRFRLGVDLDGVVVDFDADYRRCFREAFGFDMDPKPTWSGFADASGGIFPTDHDFWRWLEDTDVWWNAPAIGDALHALDELHHVYDVDIVIVSSKPQWAVPRVFSWLADHRVPTREVHITGGGYKRKTDVDCDAYVDDSPHQLRRLANERPDRLLFRFCQPWNDGNVPGYPVAELNEMTGCLLDGDGHGDAQW